MRGLQMPCLSIHDRGWAQVRADLRRGHYAITVDVPIQN